MISIPRLHGIYQKLLNYHSRYLYLFSFTVCGILVSSWSYCLYCPSIARNQQLEQNIAALHSCMVALSKSKKELFALSQSILELKKNNQIFSHKENSQQNLHAHLSCITQCATAAGMQIVSCKLSSVRCCADEIIGEFSATYDQVICFFEFLKSSDRLIDVNKCDLVRTDENKFLVNARFSTSCV